MPNEICPLCGLPARWNDCGGTDCHSLTSEARGATLDLEKEPTRDEPSLGLLAWCAWCAEMWP